MPPPPAALQALRPGRTLNVQLLEPTAPPSGATVFLMHGAGGRFAQWRFVAPALRAAGHRVAGFDALGHGESPAPRDWPAHAVHEWVADLRALIAREGGARNWLVGHSLGTWVVLQALLEGLPNAERAFLLAPPGPGALPRPSWLTYLPVPLLERFRPRLSAGFRAAAWAAEADPALVEEESALSDRNSLYVFKAMWRQPMALDAGALRGLGLPIKVLAGAADRLTPVAGARALAALLPGATLTELTQCGHQIPLEAPRAVVDALLGAGPLR